MFLVYKRIKNIPRADKEKLVVLEHEIICTASKKGFFNVKIFIDWFNEMYKCYFKKAVDAREHVLIIIDSAPAHKISELEKTFTEE